jgi:DNA repair protein SbcC/Rad50
MKITHVTLHNVKSYGDDTRVDFADQVNLIKGENGAGKSTILEAIGYTLFDSSPYNKSEFVRLGSKKGEIRVGIIGSDGRQYEIVRGVGSSSTYYVFDCEWQAKLDMKGADDVKVWLREQLNVGEDALLKSLFEDVIGVPQGTMTAVFLDRPADRETKFNRLLRLESYQEAYKKLKTTDDYIDGLIQQNKRSQENRRGQLIFLSSFEAEQAALAADINALDAVLTDYTTQLTSLAQQIEADEAARAAVETARTALAEHQRKVEQRSEAFRQSEALRQESEAAAAVVTETTADHDAYKAAEEALQAALARQRERDNLRNKQAENERAFSVTAERQRSLTAELEKVERAEADVVRLAPLVAEQERLEADQRSAEDGVKEHQRWSAQLDADTRSLNTTRSDFNRLTELLAQREALEVTIRQQQAARDALKGQLAAVEAQQPPLRAQLLDVGKRLKEADARLHQYEDARKTAEQLEREAEATAHKVERLRGEVHQRGELALQIEQEEAEREATQQARVEAQAVLKSAHYQLETLEKGQSLLNVEDGQCPVCHRPMTADSLKDAQAHFEHERADLNHQLEAAAQTVSDSEKREKTLTKTIKGLQKQIDLLASDMVLEGDLNKLSSLEKERDASREVVITLSDAPELVKAVTDEQAALDFDLAALDAQRAALSQQINALTAEVDAHQAELNRLPQESERQRQLAEIARLEVAIANAQTHMAQLAGVEERLANIKAALDKLNNPRRNLQIAQADADKRPDVEAQIAQAQIEQASLTEQRAELEQNLAPFAGLDAAIEAANTDKSRTAAGFQRYMQHITTAGLLNERLTQCEAAQVSLNGAQADFEAAQAHHTQVSSGYDADAATVRRQMRDDVRIKKAGTQSARDEKHKQLGKVEEEIRGLQRVQAELAQLTDEAAQLEQEYSAFQFARKKIKDAGEKMRERLVKSISSAANEIFGQIMGDYSPTLTWGSDYGITVYHKGETRSFRQLSGGEQMAAALSVRLALLTETTDIRFVILDEPTTNLDDRRRTQLADRLGQIRRLHQVFVISHDDTFERSSYHIVNVTKAENGSSQVSF